MANLSKDIQCAGSDTRPPMLDKTNFASWQQRIRLYCRGKENGVNILKSIDEGPFQMGAFWETLAEGTEGHMGQCEDAPGRFGINQRRPGITIGRFVTAVKLNRGLRDSNYDQLYAYLKQHEAHANENKMMLDQFTQHIVDPLALMSNVSHQQYYSQSSTTLPSTYVPPQFADNSQLDSGLSPTDNLIENLTNTLALLTQSYKTYLPQTNNQLRTSSNPRNQATVQDGRVVKQGRLSATTAMDLALNVDNVFQADDCDAFDSDVDEAPTAHTMFMANLSSVDPVYDEAGPSYDLDILYEVHDHNHYQDVVCEHHEEQEMHDDVQPTYVDNSHANYTSDSNMIPYDQYVKDNAMPVVQSNVSSIPNDAYMMIFNDMHELHVQSVSDITRNTVVDNSLPAELATYKEQVELYERRARFELTKREQKIDEKLRIVITDRNIKEENLKKKLHSVKMQLASTINHNKSMVEEVTSVKKDFKQKENKHLEEFLDMKALKEKECYLTEVIPFFKTLKEHFEGIQKALTKEIKEIKDIFEELEAEVDQNVVNRKHDEIERKNLLIENDNLIADCLSKEVFYIATNSELTVPRFTEIHEAHTIVQTR
ncbi:hypothetical protein Tco_0201831 [Tanacetum coccineum]